MDVSAVAARVVMTQRANLRQPKRPQEGPDQGKDETAGLPPLLAQQCHAALTPRSEI
jgi:hypothetical protein